MHILRTLHRLLNRKSHPLSLSYQKNIFESRSLGLIFNFRKELFNLSVESLSYGFESERKQSSLLHFSLGYKQPWYLLIQCVRNCVFGTVNSPNSLIPMENKKWRNGRDSLALTKVNLHNNQQVS